jgi:glucose-1-phosphate adenylyltransferase
LRQHLETDADLTVGTIPVDRKAATAFGIMHTDDKRRIVEFVEKPKDPQTLDNLRIPSDLLQAIGQPATADLYQASMGIYVFKRKVLEECLENDFADFGKNIIPAAIGNYKMHAYIFQGYWEDIGTIGAFFEASLNLTDANPKFRFNEPRAPIYTRARFLPASTVGSSTIDRSLICDGCAIEKATIQHSIIGIRSLVGEGTVLKNVILMGADYYEADLRQPKTDAPPIGIGRNCNIQNAIIDKNARIADNVVISPEGKDKEMNARGFIFATESSSFRNARLLRHMLVYSRLSRRMARDTAAIGRSASPIPDQRRSLWFVHLLHCTSRRARRGASALHDCYWQTSRLSYRGRCSHRDSHYVLSSFRLLE